MAKFISKEIDFQDPLNSALWTEALCNAVNEYLKYNKVGAGSPEGVVTAPMGSTYRNKSGGTSLTFYVKESGTGNTGWVAK